MANYPALLAEVRSPLWTAESFVEAELQQGKVQNLRRACGKLNLTLVPKGEVFSFWKQIGKATRPAGFVEGRELRQGCLIPSVGGGLCQLSNALYDLALRSGCEIVERHAHTAVVPGSAAEQGRDATVFWNYVDFRFRPQQDVLITSVLSRDELVLGFWARDPFQVLPLPTQPAPRHTHAPDTCTDCHEENCFRHSPAMRGEGGNASMNSKTSAFLIEECWPEFQNFAAQTHTGRDELFLPFRSGVLQPSRYRWERNGFSRITAATLPTAFASVMTKLGRNRGIAPVEIQVEQSNRLAEFYGRRLPPSVTHLYIAQSLVPAMWKRGDLGGRSFSILMSRLPLAVMHKKLDELAQRYPDRATFKEFRAPDWMVEAESEGLAAADKIITPHSLYAGIYPRKTEKLAWVTGAKPPVVAAPRGAPPSDPVIAFPGPALARKGAFELREAAKSISCRILTIGKTVEVAGFWQGLPVEPACDAWPSRASVVVQPAFIENNPRTLIRALSAGIPVIATPECGLENIPGLTIVPAGDVMALQKAMSNILKV